jgi:ABC-2 type transport system permease protein
MAANTHAVRQGLVRGATEFRLNVTNRQDITFMLLVPTVLLVVLFFQRNTEVAGTTLPLATLAMPGVMGMYVAYIGLVSPAYAVAVEREDGTLLRLKAVPHGIQGYVSGQVLRASLETLFGGLMVLVPGLILFDNLMSTGLAGWLTLLWVLALGLLATLPLGLVIGSLMRSAQAIGGASMLVIGGLTAISGIFYPIIALPAWLQVIGQVFPVYWLGLGMRSAMLPSDAVTVEIGDSWRSLETVGVLGAWAIVGLVLAPLVLSRMARRESGSRMADRQQRALQRIG